MKLSLFNSAINTALCMVPMFNSQAIGTEDNDWLQVAPYGQFPSANRKRLQVFTKEMAESMVAHFNSVFAKLGRAFRGVPIYIGHPDADPKLYTDHARRGKVIKLEAREDGLYAQAQWNDLGRKNQEEGYYVFPSVCWEGLDMGSEFHPQHLVSIGLVNTPNISSVEPWTNSKDLPAPPEPNNNKQTQMNEELLKLLGFNPGDTPTEEEIKSAVAEVMSRLKKTESNPEMEALENKVEELSNSIAALQPKKKEEANSDDAKANKAITTAANSLIDSAITDGRATEGERKELVNSFLKDFDKADEVLKAKQPNSSKSLNLGNKKPDFTDEVQKQEAFHAEVNSRIDKKNMTYDQAFNSVSNDPNFKHLAAK